MFRFNMKKDFKPIEIQDGFANVKIYQCVNNKNYLTYMVTWWAEGKRQRRAIAELTEAKREARRIAKDLADGRASMVAVSTKELVYFRDLEKKMGGTPLSEAVNLWLQTTENKLPKITVSEIIKEMLNIKLNDTFIEKKHKQTLQVRWGKFEKTFGSRVISTIRAKELDSFLANPEWQPRTRQHYRGSISMIFDYAKRKDYLEPDKDHQAEKTESIRVNDAKLESWSVEDMRLILRHAPKRIIPWIVLGAFAGVRAAEIERMSWEDIDWSSNLILIKGKLVGRAKTRNNNDRTITMTDNLKSWLIPFRTYKGNILKSLGSGEINKDLYAWLEDLIHKIQKEKPLFSWKPNANRHSFATYYLAMTGDASTTALAMGNSPTMLLRRYKTIQVDGKTVTRAMAEKYFAILPGEGATNKNEESRKIE
jgi:integrase